MQKRERKRFEELERNSKLEVLKGSVAQDKVCKCLGKCLLSVNSAMGKTNSPSVRLQSGAMPTDFACDERRQDLSFHEEFGEDNSDCVGSIRVGVGPKSIETDKHFRLAFDDVDTMGANCVIESKSTKRFKLFERHQNRPGPALITAKVKSTSGHWGTGDFSIENFEMPLSGDITDLLHVFISTILAFTARLRRKQLHWNPCDPIPFAFKVHYGDELRGGPCVTMKSCKEKDGYFLVDNHCHFMNLVASKLWMPTWFPVWSRFAVD